MHRTIKLTIEEAQRPVRAAIEDFRRKLTEDWIIAEDLPPAKLTGLVTIQIFQNEQGDSDISWAIHGYTPPGLVSIGILALKNLNNHIIDKSYPHLLHIPDPDNLCNHDPRKSVTPALEIVDNKNKDKKE